MIQNNNILSYDTIKLTLTRKCLYTPISFVKEIEKYVDIDVRKRHGEVTFTGKVKNFRVWGNHHYVTLQGSIAKFVKGNNLGDVTLVEVKQGIGELGAILHLPLEQALLGRVDLSCNLLVDNYPEFYFNYLGELPLFNRRVYENSTLYYEKRHKVLVFYDKVEEIKHWGSEYVLRFETRVMGHELKRVWQENRTPTAAALCNPDFYRALCCNSWDWYRSIQKKGDNPLSCLFEELHSSKDIEDRCICYANRYFDLRGQLKRQFQNRTLETDDDYQKHYRLQKRIRMALHRSAEFTSLQPLEKELDDKLQQVFEGSLLVTA